IPLQLARYGVLAPIAASLAPLFVDAMLDRADSDDARDAAHTIAQERVRLRAEVAGHALEDYASVRVDSEGRSLIDHELYRFVGDRVLVFSSRDLARRVLTDAPAPGESLAGS